MLLLTHRRGTHRLVEFWKVRRKQANLQHRDVRSGEDSVSKQGAIARTIVRSLLRNRWCVFGESLFWLHNRDLSRCLLGPVQRPPQRFRARRVGFKFQWLKATESTGCPGWPGSLVRRSTQPMDEGAGPRPGLAAARAAIMAALGRRALGLVPLQRERPAFRMRPACAPSSPPGSHSRPWIRQSCWELAGWATPSHAWGYPFGRVSLSFILSFSCIPSSPASRVLALRVAFG